MMEVREAMAFALFHAEWNDENDKWATETDDAKENWQRWRAAQSALNEEHCGDCTNQPATCFRCYIEGFWEAADELIDAACGMQ